MDVEARTTRKPGFRSMYREHYGLVWGAARRFGVADHQLDDAVQEAFLVAYRRLGSFDGQSPKAWLYSITRRVASNYRRAEQRATRRRHAAENLRAVAQPSTAEAMEAWQAVNGFLAMLTEREREIFVLSEIEGMTGAEVARSLGLRPSTTYDAIRGLRRRFVQDVVDAPKPGTLRAMARRERPRATSRTWGALVAALPAGPAPGPAGFGPLATWATLSAGTKTAIAGATLTTVLGGGFVLASDRPEQRRNAIASVDPPRPAPAEQPIAEATPTPHSEATPDPHTEALPPPEAERPKRPRPATATQKRSTLADENALLREGTVALARGEASRALELADEHARDFPTSALSDMRTALRVESLCALGKQAQARGEAHEFLRRRPASPVRERVANACPKNTEPGP